MIGNKIGRPIMNYIFDKFETKNPGLYYLSQDIASKIKDSANTNLEVVSPERFAQEKCYMLVVVEF